VAVSARTRCRIRTGQVLATGPPPSCTPSTTSECGFGAGLRADLLQAQPTRPPAPTFAEYVPVVAAAASSGTRRGYGSVLEPRGAGVG
jgi:hypothetical protein